MINSVPNSILGLAAGVDKDGSCLHVWDMLGFGFVELGTIVRHAQKPNPGVILRRGKGVLWNAMGFPSSGFWKVKLNLQKYREQGGVNYIIASLGANRNVDNFEQINMDISMMMEELDPYVNAFSINFASPNTKNLRAQMVNESFERLLINLRQRNKKRILLKLHPDFSNSDELNSILDVVNNSKLDGVIFSNTTRKRFKPWANFPDYGGLSGEILKKTNLETLPLIRQRLESDKIIIGCGGIMDGDDINNYKKSGADLVQVYTGLVLHPLKLLLTSVDYRKRTY